MSAIINPSPIPVQAPPERIAAPLIPVPAEPPSRKNWKWWVALAAVLVAAGLAYLAFRSKPEEQSAGATVRTVKVIAGPFQRVLRVTGTTAARNFATITAPMMRGPDSGRNLVLIELAPAGSIVKKG